MQRLAFIEMKYRRPPDLCIAFNTTAILISYFLLVEIGACHLQRMKASLSNLNMSVFSYGIQKTLILVLKDHGYVICILDFAKLCNL